MRPLILAASTSLFVMAAACGADGQTQDDQTPPAAGAPVETRPANGATQTPAFEGKTRAPGVHTEQAMTTTVVAPGLSHPWGLASMPDGRWLVTERPGRLRIITSQGEVGEPITGLPPVDARG